MFERFTERARHVMVLAQEEARRLGHDHIGTEHLLLGLVREDGGPVPDVLHQHGVTVEALRARVDSGVTHVDAGMPFTPRAKHVLELSLREALQLQHNYIGPEHILLAIIREGEGVGARLLTDIGLDLAEVRREVVRLVDPRDISPRRARLARRPRPLSVVSAPVVQAGPVCPNCFEPLAGRLRNVELEAEAPAGRDADPQGPRTVTVVYCSGCGAALGAFPSPSAGGAEEPD